MYGLISLLLFIASPAAQATPPSDPTQELRALDQSLLNAIAPGDVKTWDAVLAPNAVYVDENGEIIHRADFLKQFQPLPKSSSGNIQIVNYETYPSGDTVSVIHRDDETELFHGQHLTATYLMTESWQRQNGNWKLLMVHSYSVLKEPKSIALPPAALDAYVGRYSAASDLMYTIRREGDHLVAVREGRPDVPLLAEAPDVFFVRGQLRNRKVFTRDGSGRVTGFADRREGNDLVWKRLP